MGRFLSRKALSTNLKALGASPSALEAAMDRSVQPLGMLATGPGPYGQTNAFVSAAVVEIQHAQSGWLYRNVPPVRSVIDLIARNVAQLPLGLYEEGPEHESTEVYDHPALQSVYHPNDQTPAQSWVRFVAASYLIYNDAFCVKFPRPDDTVDLEQFPTEHVGILGPMFFRVSGYRLFDQRGSYQDVKPERVIHWRGYNPLDPRGGISPMDTLRKTLVEDAASQAATTELSKAGLAPPGYVARPLESPELDDQDATRILEHWRQSMKNPGRSTAMLEEGMKYESFGISPKDAEALAGRRFTTEEVCRIYGVPPSMLGLGDPDEAEHQRFYQDVLAPLCEYLCSYLDLSLLQQEYDASDLCFKFDLDEKLRGDPVTRFAALTSAAGRPWLTVNETRAIEDREPIKGGDDLAIPANVILGGAGDPNTPQLPAPNVMPPQNPLGPPQDGSHRAARAPTNGKAHLIPRRQHAGDRRDGWARKTEAALLAYFSRRENATKSDDPELETTLRELAAAQVASEGSVAAARMASTFDPAHVRNYLAAKARNVAAELIAQTDEDVVELGRSAAYSRARDVRAPAAAMKLATDNAAFAVKEATRQTDDFAQRMVTIAGGDCEVCKPYQGTWRVGDLEAWPAYHPNCNCIADVT